VSSILSYSVKLVSGSDYGGDAFHQNCHLCIQIAHVFFKFIVQCKANNNPVLHGPKP